jgi:hypothetical protein
MTKASRFARFTQEEYEKALIHGFKDETDVAHHFSGEEDVAMDECLAVGRIHEAQKLGKSGLLVLFADFRTFERKPKGLPCMTNQTEGAFS